MSTLDVVLEAKRLASSARMRSSAELCAREAVRLYGEGAYEAAHARALKSLAYSVGIWHYTYQIARAAK